MSRRQRTMHFELTRACGECPFRVDVPPFLRVTRVESLHREMLDQEKTFVCHQTIGKREQHCAGALRFIETVMGKHGHALLRIAFFLGLYQPGTVRTEQPVYASREAMLTAYREANQ